MSPGRFADVIRRQLDLFEREEAAMIVECEEAERAYDAAERSYRGVQATFEKRFSSNWNAAASYTYSRTEGNHFEPTVLVNCRQDMDIVQKEVFGQVLPVVTFSDLDEAIAFANDTV